MSVEIPCPSCGAVLRAPAGMAGHKARCRKCHHGFRLPGVAAEESAGQESVQLSGIDSPAFNFEQPATGDEFTPEPAATEPRRSKSKYKSSIAPANRSGTSHSRHRGDTSKAGLFLTLFGLAAVLIAVAAALYFHFQGEKPAPASVAAVPKEKPAEPAKEKDRKDLEKPDRKGPSPKTDAEPKSPKGSDKPRVTMTGGLKLGSPPEKVEALKKPDVRISAEFAFAAVRQVFVSVGDTPVAAVVWASEPGFQNQGAKDTVDRYNLTSGDRIDRTVVDLGNAAWPRACDLSPNGEHFLNEGPAGTLTLYDLNAKAKVGTPFQPFAEEKPAPGLAAAFLADESTAIAVAKDGRLETWNAKEGKRLAAGSLGSAVAPRSLAMNGSRTKLIALAGSSLVEAPVKSLAPAPVLSLPKNPGYGYAIAMADERVAVAYRATEPGSHTRLVVARLGDPKPSLDFHLDDALGPPDALAWCGAEAFTLAFEKPGAALVVETEVNHPMAVLWPKGGQAKHALSNGRHFVLMPDPADAKKCVLLGLDFPPDDYLPLRNEAVAEKKPIPFLLTVDGFGR